MGEMINGNALIIDFILKIVGLVGLGTILGYVVKFSKAWGVMETKVDAGFASNSEEHKEIKTAANIAASVTRDTRERLREVESDVAVLKRRDE